MDRKPAGFWRREDVQALEDRYVLGEITLDDAALELQGLCEKLGVNQPLEALKEDVKWYARDARRRLGQLPPASTEVVTVRFSPAALEAFRNLARRTSRSLGSVVSEMAEEALKMRQHPGIAFAGPTGDRRARLEGGPDVWEVVAIYRMGGEDTAQTLRVLSHLMPRQLDAALQYYRTHSEEVDRLVAENERPIEEWRRLYPHLIPGSQAAV